MIKDILIIISYMMGICCLLAWITSMYKSWIRGPVSDPVVEPTEESISDITTTTMLDKGYIPARIVRVIFLGTHSRPDTEFEGRTFPTPPCQKVLVVFELLSGEKAGKTFNELYEFTARQYRSDFLDLINCVVQEEVKNATEWLEWYRHNLLGKYVWVDFFTYSDKADKVREAFRVREGYFPDSKPPTLNNLIFFDPYEQVPMNDIVYANLGVYRSVIQSAIDFKDMKLSVDI